MIQLKFNGIENIYATGDIHCNFSQIPYNIKKQKIENSLLIFCGDIGFGFAPEHYYNKILESLSRKLVKHNNTLIFFRGNHDNPSYFDGEHQWGKKHINIYAIEDYTVLNINNQRNILCIGGATSIDRTYRINSDKIRRFWYKENNKDLDKSPKSYWPNETVILDTDKIKELADNNIFIDTVCTHTCPSFAFPKDKREDIEDWYYIDPKLKEDLNKERKTMDIIYSYLKENNHPITKWIYGHFHMNNKEIIDGCEFLLLDMYREPEMQFIPIL